MNRNFDCEDEIQEVSANMCILVFSSCTAVASAFRYVLYIPILFRRGQLEVQFKLLYCPGCVTSLRLANTLSTMSILEFCLTLPL